MEKEMNTIEDTTEFVNAECERCGGVLRVDREKGEAVCPYCGAKTAPDHSFCQSCGKRLP